MSDLQSFPIPDEFKQARAVTLGVFDGVHVGHLDILARLREIDPDHGLVITFSEHPDHVVFGRQIKWICSHEERLRLLKEGGASHVLELPFNKDLKDISAQDFVKHFFLNELDSPHIVVGYDMRFGKNAQGNFDFLKEHFSNELTLSHVPAREFEREPISSTRIREAVLSGELDRCEKMMGRPYTTMGFVIEGFQRGRKLGYPTANIQPTPQTVLPPFGVYLVEVEGVGETRLAVANLGLRPTFVKDDSPLLEVHVFDYDGDLYGQTLTIRWKRFIRPEKRFASKDDLVAQIKQDIEEAKHGTK